MTTNPERLSLEEIDAVLLALDTEIEACEDNLQDRADNNPTDAVGLRPELDYRDRLCSARTKIRAKRNDRPQ